MLERTLPWILGGTGLALLFAVAPSESSAYPPAVGITGQARDCMACHVANGPWSDEAGTIIDILDRDSRQSLRAADGAFEIPVPRGQTRTVLTVIGRVAGDAAPAPLRNAWTYVDPTQLETSSLSKFAPGWDVSLPMSCRLVGDAVPQFPGARVTALPMTIRPGDAARDAVVELQVMLTSGESVKGDASQGLVSNYFLRHVRLRVTDPPRGR